MQATTTVYRRRWLAAAAAALVAPAPCTGIAEDRDAEDPEITALSFNIRYDNPGDGENAWPERRVSVVEFLRSTRPDLVGLQEALAHQLDYLLENNPEFDAVGVGRDDGARAGEFSAILYRRDRFDLLADGTFWLSDTPEVPGSASWGNDIPRVCTWARFRDKAGGGTFYHLNTHFDHRSQPSRERSAELLTDRVQGRPHHDEPVILTGDLNAGESNAAVKTLTGVLTDTFRAAHPDAQPRGTFHGFSGEPGEHRIDYVMVDGGFETRSAEILRPRPGGGFVSDHEPVSATLVFSTGTAEETRTQAPD